MPGDFLFGVATAGFQVEGGFNGPGEPANNWRSWERAGRVEASGNAVDFWNDPDASLDRAAALGCTSFRMGVEWARVEPAEGEIDRAALDHYRSVLAGCRDRGMEPLLTLHHFTHPAWLGEEFWLRPDAVDRFGRWAALAVDSFADLVRLWVTINEINVIGLSSWLVGIFPPGRRMAFADAWAALDNLLAAHVRTYETIHAARPDAVVTTNDASVSVYELDHLLVDLLLARSMGVEPGELDAWITERRAQHEALVPATGTGERAIRALGRRTSPYGTGAPTRMRTPRRVVDAVFDSPHERALDILGIDYYDPVVSHHVRLPGHRTAGGRTAEPGRRLWDDLVDTDGLGRWLRAESARAPGMDLWVVENGLCNRVVHDRSYPRLDGWDRSRYLRASLGAVVDAVADGVPVRGYWHWSLVDNYEWGSYEPRFGIFGVDRNRGPRGFRWLETDSLGGDAGGAYREAIAAARGGDRAALVGS
ncbi:MAG: family 1 glycosylhydrolase [Actinomycetota bacterium]|nr:family 1 glycosylhydrolase [Actinomycetota bacterium]